MAEIKDNNIHNQTAVDRAESCQLSPIWKPHNATQRLYFDHISETNKPAALETQSSLGLPRCFHAPSSTICNGMYTRTVSGIYLSLLGAVPQWPAPSQPSEESKHEYEISLYSQPTKSHVLGGLAGSWRTQQRAAGGRRDRHLETMTSYQKWDSVSPCVFT